jgi:hypothetical protein
MIEFILGLLGIFWASVLLGDLFGIPREYAFIAVMAVGAVVQIGWYEVAKVRSRRAAKEDV